MSKSKIVQVYYNLHPANHKKLLEIYTDQGDEYAISTKGEAYINNEGEYYPVQNPFPLETLRAQGMRMLPVIVGIASTVALIIIITFYFLLPSSPAIQEAFLSIVATYGYYTQVVATLIVCLIFAASAIVAFTKGVRISRTDVQADPDSTLIVISSRHQNDATLEDRLRVALNRMSDTTNQIEAVAVVRFADPVAYLYTPEGTAPRMDRNAPRLIAMPDFAHTIFVGESWDEYQDYLREFSLKMREEILRRAHARPGKYDATIENHYKLLRNAVGIILLLLCSISANAQKSRQVAEYLGADRYNSDKPVGETKFVFQAAVLARKGDGNFTYKQLLPDAPRYTDAENAGKLIAIRVAGKVIAAEKAKPPVAEQVKDTQQPPPLFPTNADPVRPRPAPGTEAPSTNLSLPDSVQMVKQIEGAKTAVDQFKSGLSRWFRPVWSLIMYVFNGIIAILICVGGLFRYISKSAANESMIDLKGRTIAGAWIVQAQQNSAGFLIIITWIISVILLIEIFLTVVTFSISIWMLILLWILILKIAELVTDKIVPNPRMNKERRP